MENNKIKNTNDKRKNFIKKMNEEYVTKDFSGPANEKELRYLNIRHSNHVINSEIPGNDR